jgi:uncharacterized protein (DUF305 family)
MMILTKKTVASLILFGVVPFASLSLAACSSDSPTQTVQVSPNPSPAPMNHSAMMSMDLGPADESFDLRFIDGMIPHHEGAVAMAQEALQKSDRPEIQQLAQAIIAAQEQEISQLQDWRSAWYPNAGDEPVMYSAEMGHTMPMTEEMRSGMMMNEDLGATDDQFDLRFINAMIPHHEGAIDMAQQALEKSDRPEVKTLAQNILDSQQQEINQMQQWRQEWYGQ